MNATSRLDPLSRRDAIALAAIFLWGIGWLGPWLGYPHIHAWDESLHQAVARGVFDTFFYPHIYVEHLYPHDPTHFWAAEAWMNKPPAPFWAAAALMHVIGVTPAALRIVSLVGMLGGAAAMYLVASRLAGRVWAFIAALGLLALPFTWMLVTGQMFGDVTDCTLLGWVTVAFAALVWSIERGSWRWAAAAGASTGVAFLCKVFLALTPLGVALALFVLSRVRFCRGPSAASLATMVASAIVVALPWYAYAATTWPEPFWLHMRTWLGHAFAPSGPIIEIGPWQRPVDAVFNEIHATTMRPLPVLLPLLSGIWLLIRAVRRRELAVVGLALWVWATWIVLTISPTKVPACTWGAAAGVLAAVAVLAADTGRHPILAAATVGTLATPLAIRVAPSLGRVRELVPAALAQTRMMPGLAEGAVIMLVVLAIAVPAAMVFGRNERRLRWLRLGTAAPAQAGVAWLLLISAPAQQREKAREHLSHLYVSYTREVGLALDKNTPKRSVIFQGIDYDPFSQFEIQNLIFWSGRMVYRRPPDVATARAKGYHPYWVSPLAEPYAPVPGIPAHAWLRAYDLERPTEALAPLPDGHVPIDVAAGGLRVLGFASGPIDGERDRWAFFARQDGGAGPLPLRFVRCDGEEEQTTVGLDATLTNPGRALAAAWFVLPVVGPPAEDVRELVIGSETVRTANRCP